MSKQITLSKIKENMGFFASMYDDVRLVDPLQKCVLEYDNCSLNKTDNICFNYWKNSCICENCISTRAYNNNNSFMKLEYKPNMILMVTAIPVENGESPVVLELLRNVTNSIMIGNGDYNDGNLLKDYAVQFNDLVIKDKLTYLYNRNYIDDRFPADVVRTTLTEAPLSVIFIDVDNLKSINDTYGHQVGDIALKEVGNAIKNSIRLDNDWAARYGGDEFLVCLNNTDKNEAFTVAEKIRNNIEKSSLFVHDKKINFTISAGIYTMKDSKHNAEEILNFADFNMYAAKKCGKNCINNLNSND